jgi:hypothetical protein
MFGEKCQARGVVDTVVMGAGLTVAMERLPEGKIVLAQCFFTTLYRTLCVRFYDQRARKGTDCNTSSGTLPTSTP